MGCQVSWERLQRFHSFAVIAITQIVLESNSSFSMPVGVKKKLISHNLVFVFVFLVPYTEFSCSIREKK